MNHNKILEILYPYIPGPALADYLGLTVSQIYNRVHNMGVKKNPRIKYLQNRALRLNSGMNYRFKPGREAFNKGIKMNSELYAKVAPTMFKPGHKPVNTREDNSTSIRADKTGREYSYTKIKDSKWVLTHRLIWEQAHGPIPGKHMVRFIDGNTMNLDISNLECIPMGENAIRNSIHRFPGELQKVIRLKAKLNKQIKNKQNG